MESQHFWSGPSLGGIRERTAVVKIVKITQVEFVTNSLDVESTSQAVNLVNR